MVAAVVGERVAGFLHDAGAGRGRDPEVILVARFGTDVVELPPGGGGVADVGDQPEQAAGLGIHDHVDREEEHRSKVHELSAQELSAGGAGHAKLAGAAAAVGDVQGAGQTAAEQPARVDEVGDRSPQRPGRADQGPVLVDMPAALAVAGDHPRGAPVIAARVVDAVPVRAADAEPGVRAGHGLRGGHRLDEGAEAASPEVTNGLSESRHHHGPVAPLVHAGGQVAGLAAAVEQVQQIAGRRAVFGSEHVRVGCRHRRFGGLGLRVGAVAREMRRVLDQRAEAARGEVHDVRRLPVRAAGRPAPVRRGCGCPAAPCTGPGRLPPAGSASRSSTR